MNGSRGETQGQDKSVRNGGLEGKVKSLKTATCYMPPLAFILE